jgi:hypothetical protein
VEFRYEIRVLRTVYGANLSSRETLVEEIIDHANAHIFRHFSGNQRAHIPSEIFKLRYDIYCLERSFLRADEFPEGIELDAFDNCSRHFAAYTLDELLIGTVRLVLWSNLPGHLNRWKIHHLRSYTWQQESARHSIPA